MSAAARVQVLERAIDILGVLAKGRATLSEVTNAVELPKGTTFRILGSLQYEKVIIKDPIDNTYQLGPGFLRLSQKQSHWFGALTILAKPAMESLLEHFEETVALHVRVGGERVCIEEMPSRHPIRYTALVGAGVPLHVGSAGKVLLASLDTRAFERMLGALDLNPITGETILDRDTLAEEVQLAREQGFAQSVGERVASAAAISVPIALESEPSVALSLLGPAARFTEGTRLGSLEELRSAAATIATAVNPGS